MARERRQEGEGAASGSVLHHTESGAGPLVVLLHPIGLDHSLWDRLPARLSATRRVLCVDLPGHGKSPAAREGAAIADYAAAVEALLAPRDEGPAALIGVSFGGMIAQELASRGNVDVSALITCGSPARIGPAERAIIQRRISQALEFGMVQAADETIPRWFTEPYAGSPMAQSVRRRLAADRLEDWVAGWRAIQDFDGLDGLSRIAVPTLAIAGEHDSATSVSDVEAVVAAIPGATLAIMKGAPHMMQLEQPDAFFGLVDEFLRTRAP